MVMSCLKDAKKLNFQLSCKILTKNILRNFLDSLIDSIPDIFESKNKIHFSF